MVNEVKRYFLFSLIACCMIAIMWPGTSLAVSAKDKYLKADACYRKLKSSSKKQKYRDQWFRCIKQFEAVYRHDPSGPWAAAGLYRSGELYQGLYKWSAKRSDKKRALEIYERIVKGFPKSRYRPKAARKIREFSSEKTTKVVAQTERRSKVESPEDKFVKADACYRKLKGSSKKQKYRDEWLRCIKKFEAVYRHDSSGPWAAAGLYWSGKLYQELYKWSAKKSDKETAGDIFAEVIKRYPKSKYRQKAETAIAGYPRKKFSKIATQKKEDKNLPAEASEDKIAKVIKKYSSAPIPVKKDPGEPGENGVTVKGLRYWSNPSYTRVVIDSDSEVSYTHRLLKRDVSIKKPQRLYVDLNNSRLGEDIQKVIPINDSLLSDVRAGQRTPGSVRVVVDIKSFKTYKIFSLKNPFRIVIDVWGRGEKRTQPQLKAGDKHAKIPPSALAKQLSLGVRRIVIDPGHGGRDFGAPGYLKGVHEKNVVLQIARRLAKKIRKDLGYEVFLTRNGDRNLTLEERTAIANTKNADLFISIHTNAAKNRKAYGIETFFLNLATDADAIRVAAMENATSTKNISDLQSILSDLMQNAKINESSRLATHVQKAMYKLLRKRYSRIRSKGVKQAPFYVLLGANMPAILIETAFISNARENKRLINANYQDRLAEAIVTGIREYVKETNPTALMRNNPRSVSKG